MGKVKYIDKGDPGKFYFEAPITHNLSWKQHETPTVYRDPRSSPPVNLHNVSRLERPATNCRLISSKNALNNTCPENIEYLLTQHPSLKEVGDYLDMKRLEGFGPGAIVARRWGEKHRYRWSQMWGTIQIVHMVPRGAMAVYHPYSVKWHMLGEIEQAWAEDLIVIHAALDDDVLDQIAEAQGVDIL